MHTALEGQRKGCGRHKLTCSSKASLLLSIPQVKWAAWCADAALSGICADLYVQAAASGACAGDFPFKVLFLAAAALAQILTIVEDGPHAGIRACHVA